MVWIFIFGFIGLCAQAYISYDKSLQSEWFYFPLGILLNAIGAFLWYYVAKITADKETYIAAVIWDSLTAFAFLVLPLVMFSVKLNWINALGLILGIIGIILMKVGG